MIMGLRPLAALVLSLAALSASAGEVQTPDGVIRFAVPDEFTVLSAEEIRVKWPTTASPPSFAVGNDRRSVTVAYDLRTHRLLPADLNKTMAAFGQLMVRLVPGLEWKRRELVELSGRQWILMELTSSAIDTDIYNIMLVTSFRDRMLTLNFNATRSAFEQAQAALRASVASVRLDAP